jgi:hypothetical protein
MEHRDGLEQAGRFGIVSAEPNTEVRRKYLEIRNQSLLARNYAASGWK